MWCLWQLRSGIMFVMDYPAAQTAASRITSRALSIANGLMSYMQVHGTISIMDQIMVKPFSDPTSWLAAMATARTRRTGSNHGRPLLASRS